ESSSHTTIEIWIPGTVRTELRFLPGQAPDPTASFVSGTVTFLLLEVVSSAALQQQTEQSLTGMIKNCRAIFHNPFHRHGGQVVTEAGNSFGAVFARASDAVAAAVTAQQAIAAEEWPKEPVGVRMALHTGEVRPKEGGYFGPTLDQAARLLSAVHGGQIVCSEATAFLLSRVAEPGLRVVDLGAYRLRGVETVE